MTGPEHYAESQRLLGVADRQWPDSSTDELNPQWAFTMQRAQVHATLALAAATAAAAAGIPWSSESGQEWRQVIAP